MLLDRTCAACGRRGPSPCAGCLAELRPAPALRAPPGIDRCWSLLAYEGPGRELVARLKYRNRREALGGLARAAASLVDEAVDVVTWPPTTPARRRARGFDQSELLATAVARVLGVPSRRLLLRLDTGAQTGRGRLERLAGPSFEADRAVRGRVLLVDDVATTGATLGRAGTALRRAGASTIFGLTIARGVLKTTT